jgi:hypothetical protein
MFAEVLRVMFWSLRARFVLPLSWAGTTASKLSLELLDGNDSFVFSGAVVYIFKGKEFGLHWDGWLMWLVCPISGRLDHLVQRRHCLLKQLQARLTCLLSAAQLVSL